MKWILPLAIVSLCLAGLAAGPAGGTATAGGGLKGDYLEARTCDVWTGPCFSNSEINNYGDMAVLGWTVREGSRGGVPLEGLSVAVALRAEGTLTTDREGKVLAVVYIDERATPEQGTALASLARGLGGKYLARVVDTRRARIVHEQSGESASLLVGEVARVRTTALNHCTDMHCGNEEVAYPALTRTEEVACAKALEHSFKDAGLDARWSDPMKRSAMVGKFALPPAGVPLAGGALAR